ncbi:NepR family anti-sigma factor [Pseudogemmobacter faecipullorum]|uniref:Anti-sigma factor NepR domain-containing protein n=1 Tax=Pseudogemmobacter faecipullorum TaxID=2755041 RepID=A0ABS8CKK0_9RHOB|nr:NepR family anti-sigma factor [Pseudogemmobacter faecipullorum]MCB5409928.1 hypothetical protein [Pseudogemmobacter faecipullorum]
MTKEAPEKPGIQPGSSRNRETVKAQIDENLRRAYDAVLTEEVPDRFKDLLARLQGGSADSGTKSG